MSRVRMVIYGHRLGNGSGDRDEWWMDGDD
jgi:hypothetical protein